MQRVLSAEKPATGAKSRKLHYGTPEWGAKCGKQETGAMLGKTYVWYQARDSMCLSQAQKTHNRFSD